MTWVTAAGCVAVFVWAVARLRVVETSMAALRIVTESVSVFSDPALDDEGRERAARRASLRLFASAGSIAGRSVLALLLSLIPLAIADRTGLARVHDVTTVMMRWDVIAAATAGFVGVYLVKSRVWPTT